MKQSAFGFGRIAILVCVVLFVAVNKVVANETTVATAVLGHPDYNHCGVNNPGPSGFNEPSAVAVDSQGHLYITDTGNNRVLGWQDVVSLQNGEPADLVIGQPDFQSVDGNHGFACSPNVDTVGGVVGGDSLNLPGGIAIDTAGNLYVADTSNNRVLEYDAPFTACQAFPCSGLSAALVFGQGGKFTSNMCNDPPNKDSLCNPAAVAVDTSGNVFVADMGNSRVLEYNTPLNSGGNTTAALVFGQNGSFVSRACYNGKQGEAGGISADSLCRPTGLAVDLVGNLYVVDSADNRVLRYNTPLNAGSGEAGAGDTTADIVFGQDSFAHGECDEGTAPGDIEFFDLQGNAEIIGPDSLCLGDGTVGGVAVDATGHVYLSDYHNNRVLEYAIDISGTGPESGSPIAELVFGEDGTFTNGISGCNNGSDLGDVYGIGPDSLCLPGGLGLDNQGTLFIADSGNNRVLSFDAPISSDSPTADRVLGQVDFEHDVINALDGTGLNNPDFIAVDTQDRLYVSDTSNNRILAWRSAAAFANGAAADLVIGQNDFRTSAADFLADLHPIDSHVCTEVGASSLCEPSGLTTDALGNLFVADSGNNRILEYDTPFAACQSYPCIGATANHVLGQNGDFTASGCNLGKGAKSIGSGSLCDPVGIAGDSLGNLYVADVGNNRVLEYNTPLNQDLHGGASSISADVVFGQNGSFVTALCGGGPDGLCFQTEGNLPGPSGDVAVDAIGNLYVADSGNNRVLEYNTPLNANSGEIGAGDDVPDKVFGQSGSFVTAQGCMPGTASGDPTITGPGTLCAPVALALDGDENLYVSDFGNDRVLEYNAGDTTADLVFGQNGDFQNSGQGCPTNGPGPETLCGPKGVSVDQNGNLFIADGGNNRVLRYDLAAASFKPAPAIKSVASSAGKELEVSSRAIAFGSVGLQTTLTKSIVVTNSSLTGTITGEVESQQNSAYSVTTGGGPFSLSPGQSMQVAVEFSPSTTSTTKDALHIITNGPKSSTRRISLSGRGVPGILAVPATLSFPVAEPGVAVIESLLISNSGRGVLHGSVGPAAAPFFVNGGGAFSVGYRESLYLSVTFASPRKKSNFRDSLTITTDDPSHPRSTVVLTGSTE